MDSTYFLAGVVLTIACDHAVRLYARRKKTQREEVEPKREIPLEMQVIPAPRWQWHAMPCGTRLELSDTGFYIILDTSNPEMTYTGCTPEGAWRVRGNDLFHVKKFLEGEAAERAEFTPVKGWRP